MSPPVRTIVRDTFKGLALIGLGLAPGAIGAAIAYHFWGADATPVGAFAPYFLGLLLFIAYVIGTDTDTYA